MNTRDRTCVRVQELLEAYYEDALAPRESAVVSLHLQGCPSCAYELAQIERIALALEAVPRAEPRTDLARQISTMISALPAPVSSRRLVAGWRRVEVIAAASVVLLGIWRYALPLLLSNEAARVPIIGWFHAGAQFVMTRLAALSVAGENLWAAVQGVSGARGDSPYCRCCASWAARPSAALGFIEYAGVKEVDRAWTLRRNSEIASGDVGREGMYARMRPSGRPAPCARGGCS